MSELRVTKTWTVEKVRIWQAAIKMTGLPPKEESLDSLIQEYVDLKTENDALRRRVEELEADTRHFRDESDKYMHEVEHWKERNAALEKVAEAAREARDFMYLFDLFQNCQSSQRLEEALRELDQREAGSAPSGKKLQG